MTDLEHQLARYGQEHRSRQEPVDLTRLFVPDHSEAHEPDLLVDLDPTTGGNGDMNFRYSRWTLAVAAAVAAVIAAAGAMTLGAGNSFETATTADGAPPASTPAGDHSPLGGDELLTLGDDVVEAYYSGEPEALLALAAPGAELETALNWQTVRSTAGIVALDHTCYEGVHSGPTQRLRCEVDIADEVSHLVGYAAVETLRITAVDGRITEVLSSYDAVGQEDEKRYDEFTAWMGANGYPSVGRFCAGVPVGEAEDPRLCGEMWLAAARDYVESGDRETP